MLPMACSCNCLLFFVWLLIVKTDKPILLLWLCSCSYIVNMEHCILCCDPAPKPSIRVLWPAGAESVCPICSSLFPGSIYLKVVHMSDNAYPEAWEVTEVWLDMSRGGERGWTSVVYAWTSACMHQRPQVGECEVGRRREEGWSWVLGVRGQLSLLQETLRSLRIQIWTRPSSLNDDILGKAGG